MGNLQSILGDCQIGQVPVYLQKFVPTGNDGEESYMVYGDQLPFQRDKGGGADDDEDGRTLYYSGPTQKHVRANLLESERQQQAKEAAQQRKVLADLVDLCVDGVDSAQVRERSAPTGSSLVPGGQTYSAPHDSTQGQYLNTEVWDEAEYRAKESGTPVRVIPGGNNARADSGGQADGNVMSNVDPESQSMPSTGGRKKQKKEKKSKKKSRSKKDKTSSAAILNQSMERKDGLVREDGLETGYESESEQLSKERDLVLDTSSASTSASAWSASDTTNQPSTPKGQTIGKVTQSSPPRSPAGSVKTSIKVCREEESKLLEKLTVVVHPSEEPDSPPDQWCLLEANWFREWSAFLRGAPRPGRINNAKLLNAAAGNEPWPGLLPGKHYVGLDQVTWSLLRDIYAADVEIIRPLFDIYS